MRLMRKVGWSVEYTCHQHQVNHHEKQAWMPIQCCWESEGYKEWWCFHPSSQKGPKQSIMSIWYHHLSFHLNLPDPSCWHPRYQKMLHVRQWRRWFHCWCDSCKWRYRFQGHKDGYNHSWWSYKWRRICCWLAWRLGNHSGALEGNRSRQSFSGREDCLLDDRLQWFEATRPIVSKVHIPQCNTEYCYLCSATSTAYCETEKLGRSHSIIQLDLSKSSSMTFNRLTNTTFFGIKLHRTNDTILLSRDTNKNHPLLVWRSAIVDDLASFKVGVSIKHLDRCSIVFNGPVEDCTICNNGNCLDIQPTPVANFFRHHVRSQLALGLEIEYL